MRCKSEFSVFYLRMWYAVFEGTNMVNAKGITTGIIDHGVKTGIHVEQQAKALVFKKNRMPSALEIARKCQISKSTVA